MALFKIVTQEGCSSRKIYKEPEDLANLIYYVWRKSMYFEMFNLYDIWSCDSDVITNQMRYLQSCKGTKLHTRALHFILSFDTGGWEWEMTHEKVYQSMFMVSMAANTLGINEYQCFAGVHNNPTHRHVHFIVNPVNCNTGNILHYNKWQYQDFLREVASGLYFKFKIALQGVSYITEEGRMKYLTGNENVFLYENRRYPYEPLRVKG